MLLQRRQISFPVAHAADPWSSPRPSGWTTGRSFASTSVPTARIIPRRAETAKVRRAGDARHAGDGDRLPDRPLNGGKPRTRPTRKKLSFKNRWLLSQHLVIALRRAGVVCDIMVQDHAGNVVSLPTGDLSHPQRLGLALRCSGIAVDPDLAEADPDATPVASPPKSRH